MANRMIRIRVTRTFNRYSAGDTLLLEETAEVKKYVKAGLFSLIAVESTGKPPADSKPKARTTPKIKKPTKKKATA